MATTLQGRIAPDGPLRQLARPPLRPRTLPRLSIVIVNYCQWHDTAALVRRLRGTASARSGAAEVIVVDNHSPLDRTMARLVARLRRTPGVSLRRWGRNRGFARASNEGCRLSQGDWLLLLNPDVSVPDGFLEEVLALTERIADTDLRAGIVGLGLRNSDGSPQGSAGPFPTLAGTLARLLLPRHRRKYLALPASRRRRVPWVTGCCLLVRRDCWQQLGGFDEHFFLYYEDVDLCRRARDLGWSVWYEPGVRVTHHAPLHARAVPPRLRVFTRHALLTYAARHWPRWHLRILAGIVSAEGWLRQAWARWRGDEAAAGCFAELRRIAAAVATGCPLAARRRLLRVVGRADGQVGVDADPVHGRQFPGVPAAPQALT
jgi:GT2 family glycosyltransferase